MRYELLSAWCGPAWVITFDKGAFRVRYCIMATGCLSSANLPDISGHAQFRGQTYHTGRWPHTNVDFTGLRVAVVGTDSSGIQATPEIAKQAAHLYVFQRWSVPARNASLAPGAQAAVKAEYQAFRIRQRTLGTACHYPPNKQSALAVDPAEREQSYERWWQLGGLSFLGAFIDLIFNEQANATAAAFVRAKILALVKHPLVAAKLVPEHAVGCKRACSDTHYYETFKRDNVSLVDARESPIEAFTERGIRTAHAEYEPDAVVFATGFDAMTGALDLIDIRGVDGWHQ